MKKKIFTLALLLILIVSATGCSQPYNYDISKYLTLGTYTGIEVSLSGRETELEAGIKKLLDDNSAKNDITGRAVKTGDIVNINYVGTLGGVEFSGGSSNNYDLEIGSGTFVSGFEDGIIGKNIGEVFDVTTVFPADYTNNATLAGQTVIFKITLNSIKEKIIPELNDEFIAKYTAYKTIDEYKAGTRVMLKNNFVWNKVIESSTLISYPKENVKTYYNKMIKSYENYARSKGYTLEEYLSASNGGTVEDLLKQAAEYAKSQVRQEMIMYSIARAENISFSDDEYKNKVADYAKKSGFDSVPAMEKSYSKTDIKMNMLMQKVIDYVTGLSVEVK